MKESTLKRFFRLPRFDEHLELHRLDVTSSHNRLELYEFAKARYGSAPAEEVRPRLLVTGADLIAAGYRPGPGFRAMLDAAEDAQLEGAIRTTRGGTGAGAGDVSAASSGVSNVTPTPSPSRYGRAVCNFIRLS